MQARGFWPASRAHDTRTGVVAVVCSPLFPFASAAVLLSVVGFSLSGCPDGVAGTPAIENSTCLACHDGRSAQDQRGFNFGVHAGLRCEDCHGNGYVHVRNTGRSGLFIQNPEREPYLPSMEVCAQCHSENLDGHLGTAHAFTESVSCHECHDVHRPNAMTVGESAPADLDKNEYAQLCGQCHEVETDGYLQSVHAQLDVVSCGTCHELHTPTTFPVSPINNQLCQQCHASFALGLETEEDVDFHTGFMHPVDPAGSGSSRCTGCHMSQVEQNGAFTPRDHTLFTVPPAFSNQQMNAGALPVPPNSCAGTAGCHDPNVPGSGIPHDPGNRDQNDAWQIFYEQIGEIPE